MTQQQFQKNPNGGYLKPSDYGEGKFTGVVEITPALLTELSALIQANGTSFVRLNVSEAKQGKFGVYERATMKALTQEQVAKHQGAKTQAPAQPAQTFATAPAAGATIPAQGYQQPIPVAQSAAPQPQVAAPAVDPLEDEIPF